MAEPIAEYVPVHQRLTVRGRLALGRTANELREAGYTSSLAEEDGWTVDRHSYPWVAYLGARFNTDAFVFLHADDDVQIDGSVPGSGVGSGDG